VLSYKGLVVRLSEVNMAKGADRLSKLNSDAEAFTCTSTLQIVE